MKKQLFLKGFLFILLTTFTIYAAVSDIFKAGMGFGIFIVIVVVALIIFIKNYMLLGYCR